MKNQIKTDNFLKQIHPYDSMLLNKQTRKQGFSRLNIAKMQHVTSAQYIPTESEFDCDEEGNSIQRDWDVNEYFNRPQNWIKSPLTPTNDRSLSPVTSTLNMATITTISLIDRVCTLGGPAE